jgi:hypothetical protein
MVDASRALNGSKEIPPADGTALAKGPPVRLYEEALMSGDDTENSGFRASMFDVYHPASWTIDTMLTTAIAWLIATLPSMQSIMQLILTTALVLVTVLRGYIMIRQYQQTKKASVIPLSPVDP